MPGYPDARMPEYPDARMPEYPDARIPGCSNTRMPGCSNTRMPGCPDARMPEYPDARLPGCSDVWLPGCSDAWLPGCLAARIPGSWLPGCLAAWPACWSSKSRPRQARPEGGHDLALFAFSGNPASRDPLCTSPPALAVPSCRTPLRAVRQRVPWGFISELTQCSRAMSTFEFTGHEVALRAGLGGPLKTLFSVSGRCPKQAPGPLFRQKGRFSQSVHGR